MDSTESTQVTGNTELSPQYVCCDQNFEKPSGSTSDNHGDLTLKGPRFFQMITDDGEADQDKKLWPAESRTKNFENLMSLQWIPRRYVRKYGHDLSKYVQVTDPKGRKWKLECSKCDADTWLRNGWKEFADFYSLADGYILIFKYGGNSRFSVAIFDRTATEIEYPVESTRVDGENQYPVESSCYDGENEYPVESARDGGEKEYPVESPRDDGENDYPAESARDDGDNIAAKDHVEMIERKGIDMDELLNEIFDEFIPSSRENKKWHQSSSDQTTIAHNSQANVKKLSFSDEEYEVLSFAEKWKHRVVDERTEKSKGNDEYEALDSPHPFFSLVMQPSHLMSSSVRLYIPFSFAVDHIIKDQDDAILCLNERRWNVKYFSDTSSSRAALGIGWKIFASENDLKVGDICTFELIDEIDVTFRVRIHRVNKSGGEHEPSTTEKVVNKKSEKTLVQRKEHRTIESADKFSSENPFFRVTMQPFCLNCPFLNIPVDFVEKHFEQGNKDVLLKVEDESWPVQFSAPGRFCGGWYTFVKANSLQDRDICIFELVKKPDLILEVHIFRGK